MASGREQARVNFALFSDWVAARNAHGDHLDYVKMGKLNRSEIATELGFSRSVFSQNPAIKKLTLELDQKWGSQRTQAPRTVKEESAARTRAIQKVKRTEDSNSRLLEKIAILEEENRELRLALNELKLFRAAREAFLETTKVSE